MSTSNDNGPADEPQGSGPLPLLISLGAMAVAGIAGILGFRKHRRDGERDDES